MKPKFSHFNHAQKNELINALFTQNDELEALVTSLSAELEELKAKAALNSRNSSKPPSSDGLNKPKPKSLKEVGRRCSGGQKGHKGNTLSFSTEPDIVENHQPILICDVCHQVLEDAEVVEIRQVFDIPKIKPEVKEHRVLQVKCTCGKVHRGVFPKEVGASLQYGSVAKATMVHLNQTHMLPLKRTADLIDEFFGLPLSQATILKACKEASELLKPTIKEIKTALQNAPVLCVDETGMRVNKKMHWMHVAVTDSLAFFGSHARRGTEAFIDIGILPDYKGILIHDGWMPYRRLDCLHGLCNAHHLRELVYVFEELKQVWADDMIQLFLYANTHLHSLSPFQKGYILAVYDQIIQEGEKVNPENIPTGKRGRVKQTKARNLLIRLRNYEEDVWRFMMNPNVPFSNNLAEQTVRMPKVKQKVSGGFRTTDGLEIFCIIRSYLMSLQKQGIKLFDALIETFKGSPTQPALI